MSPVFSRTAVAAFFFIVIHPISANRKKRRRKPRWWKKELFKKRLQYGNRLFQDMAFEDSVKNFTRMTLADFENLVVLISPKVEKIDTHLRQAITVKERLAITLTFLATGNSFTRQKTKTFESKPFRFINTVLS